MYKLNMLIEVIVDFIYWYFVKYKSKEGTNAYHLYISNIYIMFQEWKR